MKILKITFISITAIFCCSYSFAQWTTSGTTTLQNTTTNNVLIGGSSISGMGTKCFWNNSKKAFRGGELGFLGNGYWDADSIGNHSFSYGINTKAKGKASVSFGQRSEANGDYSIAMGNIAIASSIYSIALGNGAKANGNNAIALGLAAEASGSSTIAIGESALSNNLFTLAVGSRTSAMANSAIAVGKDADATGSGSIAFGNNVLASGGNSQAYGSNVEAATGGAIVIGRGTISANLVNSTANSMAFGVNSTIPTLTITNSLGAGLTGKVGIGTTSPTHDLHVAGDVAVSGSIVHPSDKNLKENIQDITNGLSTINQLSPKSYTHKADKAIEFGLSTKPQFGLIAQEVEEVLPELVIQKALVGEDGEIYKGLDYEKLIPILVAAVKELSVENESLKTINKEQLTINQEQTTINKQLLEFMESQQTSK